MSVAAYCAEADRQLVAVAKTLAEHRDRFEKGDAEDFYREMRAIASSDRFFNEAMASQKAFPEVVRRIEAVRHAMYDYFWGAYAGTDGAKYHRLMGAVTRAIFDLEPFGGAAESDPLSDVVRRAAEEAALKAVAAKNEKEQKESDWMKRISETDGDPRSIAILAAEMSNEEKIRKLREHDGRFVGYGPTQWSKLLGCTPQAVSNIFRENPDLKPNR